EKLSPPRKPVLHSSRLVLEGACSWDALNAERDAAPARGARNLAPGRPRDSGRAALRPLCEELAGLGLCGRLCRLPSSQEARPRAEPLASMPVVRAAVERREASIPIARDAPRLASAMFRCALRRSAPPPSPCRASAGKPRLSKAKASAIARRATA